MKYLLKKFRKSQTRVSRKSRKNSLQSKRSSKRRSGRCCIDERRESIQRRKKNLQVAQNCAALKSLEIVFCWWLPLSRWYRTKILERC